MLKCSLGNWNWAKQNPSRCIVPWTFLTYVFVFLGLRLQFRNKFTYDKKYVETLPVFNFSLAAANLLHVLTKDTELLQESDYLACGSNLPTFTYRTLT
jgi:hypothetical protein